jgi:hypothetical protein
MIGWWVLSLIINRGFTNESKKNISSLSFRNNTTEPYLLLSQALQTLSSHKIYMIYLKDATSIYFNYVSIVWILTTYIDILLFWLDFIHVQWGMNIFVWAYGKICQIDVLYFRHVLVLHYGIISVSKLRNYLFMQYNMYISELQNCIHTKIIQVLRWLVFLGIVDRADLTVLKLTELNRTKWMELNAARNHETETKNMGPKLKIFI